MGCRCRYHPPFITQTCSYDTIGNAYFARTCHTDVAGWRRLLVITSDFHMDRSSAIFDWIFGVDSEAAQSQGAGPYVLAYHATPDVGLDADGVGARAEREARSARNVRTKLAPAHSSLKAIHAFLTSKHDLYTADKLVGRACALPGEGVADQNLLKSYGGKADSNTRQPLVERDAALALLVAFAAGALFCGAVIRKTKVY